MCIAPTVIPEKGLVACRYCWQCRNNRVNDLVGRCIAERETSSQAMAVTLTYAEGTPHAATLVYADVQKLFKRLRKAGYVVRYIVAGEYGSKKGRAHWHAVLFFRGKFPQVARERRIEWEYWPHGYSYFERPDYEGFAYILKYALKDETQQVAVGHLAMSKKPPLGHDYFMQQAERYVAAGLSPQSPAYSFRNEYDRKGKRRRFWLQGRMSELFVERFLEVWKEKRGGPYPASEYLEGVQDKLVRLDPMTNEQWADWLAEKRPQPPEKDPDDYKPTGNGGFEAADVASYAVVRGDDILVVRYTDGSAAIEYGDGQTWLLKDEKELADALGKFRAVRLRSPQRT